MSRARRRGTRTTRRWSQRVTRESNALDLERQVFTRSPRAIARSLKRSAERSRRRKASPYGSAMSMLTFYINRAGRQLTRTQRARLQAAKGELRALFGKTPRKRSRATPTWKRMHAEEDGETGVDDDLAAHSFGGIGAWILRRNMFGPV